MGFSNRLVVALAAAAGFVSAAHGQLVVGNDNTTGQLWVIDLAGGGAATRQLLSGTQAQIQGLAADNAGGFLYWTDGGTQLYKAPIVSAGTLTPTAIGGTLSPSMTGLAYDSLANKLYGIGGTTAANEGIYEIDTATGAQTLIVNVATAADFGGFDYDSVSDSFLITNDSTTFSTGRGLIRATKPLATTTFSLVTAYPGTDTDVDGLAVGNGHAYLVNDINISGVLQGVYDYDLTLNSYGPQIATPYTSGGTFSGGAWAPGMIATSGANVAISISDTPDPLVVPLATSITYTVTVNNFGPDPADNVSVAGVLPGNVAFTSVTAPGSHLAGNITANLGTMAALTSATFDVVVSFPGSPPDTVNFTLNATTTTSDPSLANNSATATTTVREPQANLGVTITDPADCSFNAGSAFTYTINVANAGPETANNVVVAFTLPSAADASFVSSSPSGSPSGGVLTINLGSIASGGNASLSVNMNAITQGAILSTSASVTANETDTNLANNTANATNRISPTPPATATHKGIFSDYAEQANSNVPGIAGVKFATFDRPFPSPNGTKVIMRVDTDAPTASDGMILVYDGSTWSIVAREGDVIPGVTPAAVAAQVDATGFDEPCGINDAGNFAISGNWAGTAADDFVLKNVGGVWTLVCDEDSTSASHIGGGATTFNDVNGGVTMAPNNMATWLGTLNGSPTTQDNVIVRNDGATVIAQEGVTIPTSQLDAGGLPTTNTWQTFITAVSGTIKFDATHTHYTFVGDTDAATTNDAIAVLDGDVKAQEDRPILGGDLLASIARSYMAPNGDWYVQAAGDSGTDYIIKNGAVLVQTDQLVPGGNPGEIIDDTTFATTFFMLAGNNVGDYVYGAVTNSDTLHDGVLVLNNSTIIARQSDPVDLNGNGIFDDDAYIRTFNDDNLYMTTTDVYVTVSLWRASTTLCGGADVQAGDAFIRIPIPSPSCPADLSSVTTPGVPDGGVDINDLLYFLAEFESGSLNADLSSVSNAGVPDGGVDINDLLYFLEHFEGGC